MESHEYIANKAKLSANEAACREWMKANKTNGIPIKVFRTFPFANEVTNDLRSAIEVHEFINFPPDKYFLYINEEQKTATTWTGEKLGVVFFGREFYDSFGGKRVPIDVDGINGIKYYGTYYKSTGSYARIKKKKNQTGRNWATFKREQTL